MGWISRYGKWQDDFARPVPGLIKFHHVIAVIFFLALLAGYIACFPLTLAFVPKPQLTEYMPKGVHCATCDEIWQYNPDLFNREDMLCYGPSTREISTKKEEEVMYEGEKRCWALEKGHDEWMRPITMPGDDTRQWNAQKKTAVIRGGRWL